MGAVGPTPLVVSAAPLEELLSTLEQQCAEVRAQLSIFDIVGRGVPSATAGTDGRRQKLEPVVAAARAIQLACREPTQGHKTMRMSTYKVCGRGASEGRWNTKRRGATHGDSGGLPACPMGRGSRPPQPHTQKTRLHTNSGTRHAHTQKHTHTHKIHTHTHTQKHAHRQKPGQGREAPPRGETGGRGAPGGV